MPERTIIQWDKNDLESLGLLKVDVLALGMLTAMQQDVRPAGNGRHRAHATWTQIPREDPETYDMICRADTVGVFQIESRAQMSMLPRLQPRSYYDLVIEVAIVRPGPDQGRHGASVSAATAHAPEEVPYPSEELRPVLEKTRGVPIFQEQVMQIAVVAAGFTPGEADQLRRAMGAWQRSGKMECSSEKLMDGMRANGYSRDVRRADLQADRRLRRVRLSRIAFGVVRAADVCLELAEMPLPRCVLRRAHQQSADGLLSAGAAAGAGQAAARADPAGRRHCERV